MVRPPWPDAITRCVYSQDAPPADYPIIHTGTVDGPKHFLPVGGAVYGHGEYFICHGRRVILVQ